MTATVRAPSSWRGWCQDKDERLPLREKPARSSPPTSHLQPRTLLVVVMMAVSAMWFLHLFALWAPATGALPALSCDSPDRGYTCSPNISHFWGQYSLFFSVPTDIPDVLPAQCTLTFAQVLSRHGGRDPTAGKSASYRALVEKLQANVATFPDQYSFLATYNYTLGADQLTSLGYHQLVHSGLHFRQRYASLAGQHTPFVRASGQQRVIESAQGWLEGYYRATDADTNTTTPSVDLIIPETEGFNNTLSHSLCAAFEASSGLLDSAQANFSATFLPPIRARLNADLPGANLTLDDTLALMDLCPFTTVAQAPHTSAGTGPTPFCTLFTPADWRAYDYYQTLSKFYAYGAGHPLGPTQGVGWTNELLARLTGTRVRDRTSSNRTLDADPTTFPLDRALYADFSHDNDMQGVLAALGVYNASVAGGMLDTHAIVDARALGGFSASWTTPFAGRVYVEKARCAGDGAERVRVLVNDRVMGLEWCAGVDGLGWCPLDAFVEGLSFVRAGGRWDECWDVEG